MVTLIWQARPVPPAGGAQQPALPVPQSYWGAPGKNNSQVQPPRFRFGTPSGSQPASYVQCSARPAYRGPTQMTGSGASNQPSAPALFFSSRTQRSGTEGREDYEGASRRNLRSSFVPRQQFERLRALTMGNPGASNKVTAAETSDLSSASETDDIPLLTLTEVASKLHEFSYPKCKPYAAMYSSIVGGITLDPAAMVVPLDDHMVHRGHGVFDTATVFDGYLYELDAHIDRLLRSAAQARIPLPFSRSVLRHILVQTVAVSGAREGTLRYWLSAGPGGFNLSPFECGKSSLYAVMIAERADRPDGGVSVISSSVPVKKPNFATMKTTNYLPNALAKMEAEDSGAFQAVWLDGEGYIAEATNMNVAFVSKGTLLVPAFDNILSGCTAKRMLVLTEQLTSKSNGGFLQNVKVGKISLKEAKAADEMMLVVSSYLIVPVTEWDGQPVGNGKVGPVTKQIYDLLRQDLINGPPEVREPVPYRQ